MAIKHERYKIILRLGQSVEDIRKQEEAIKAALWASDLQISNFGRFVYLDVYRGRLSNNIPYRLPEVKREKLQDLIVPLGYSMQGELITLDMASDSHCYLLGAGYQGTGKSVLANGIIRALVEYPPEWVKLVAIDLKMGVEFRQWSNYPHVWLKATDPEKGELKHVVKMLNKHIRARYAMFEEHDVKDIHQYRAKVGPLNYIFLIVDEFAELANTKDGEEMQTLLKRTFGIGRAAGLRCALFTQRPTVDNITGSIKALFNDRIALRCATALESKIILDQKGAEDLEDYPGRAILLTGAKYQKIQIMNYEAPDNSACGAYSGKHIESIADDNL